jgi:hypothetical protein
MEKLKSLPLIIVIGLMMALSRRNFKESTLRHNLEAVTLTKILSFKIWAKRCSTMHLKGLTLVSSHMGRQDLASRTQ